MGRDCAQYLSALINTAANSILKEELYECYYRHRAKCYVELHQG